MLAPFKEVRKLVAPVRNLLLPKPKRAAGLILPGDPRDPSCVGYDKAIYQGLAIQTQESEVLDFSSTGNDSAQMSKDRLITCIDLVADPYQADGDGANTPTIVEDAQDKLISQLNVNGSAKPFVSINGAALAYLKALGNLNKVVYPGLRRGDLPTGTGANQTARFMHRLHFGAMNDYDLFDITAGIPAQLLNALQVSVTWGADNVFAATSTHQVADTNTDVYVVSYGVQGLPTEYLQRCPIPEITMDFNTAPSARTIFKLLGQRYLKRTTILNLAAAASNNAGRNDSNLTDVTLRLSKPATGTPISLVRWQTFRASLSGWGRGPEIDKDGAAAVAGDGLTGVAVIDWRRWTKNPYGLNLMAFGNDDAQLEFNVGTTTGSIYLLHEYYAFPDPSVPDQWANAAWRPQ